MSKRVLLALAVLCLSIFTIGAAAAVGQEGDDDGSDMSSFAHLNGANEVGEDDQTGAGDTNGRGSASVLIAGNRVCFGVSWDNLDRVVAAHIHRAAEGSNGTVVVDFRIPSGGLGGDPGSRASCVVVNRVSVRNGIRDNPENYYVNVHTRRFQSGAIRGQLSHDD